MQTDITTKLDGTPKHQMPRLSREMCGLSSGESKESGMDQKNRKEVREVWVGGSEWITKDEWKEAATANQLGCATEQQKEWLKNGHRKA